MKSVLIGLLLLATAHPVVASSLRKEWNNEDHPQSVTKFQRQPAGTASHHRQLQLNGGHMFIVASKRSSDGRQWCMDAFQGPPGHRALQEEPVPELISENEPLTMSRKECREAYAGTIVGDIGNGAIFRPNYVCESDGNPPIGTVLASPGEPIASEGEVCCGSRPQMTRDECVNVFGGSIVGDIGNGAIHRPGYRCESNAEAPIGTIYPLPGEPIAIEGEVCCGSKGGNQPFTMTRKECREEYGGIIVGDSGNGAIFQPGYVCESDGNSPLGTVIASPGEPIASEGEVCCGSRRREMTRYECVNDYGGSIVGDIGDGTMHRPEYRCQSNGKAPIGTVYPLPGEPIADEGEVCCGPGGGQNPLVGLRPCEFVAAPPGQLFDYTYGPSGNGNIGSRFYAPDYSGFCLMPTNGKKIPEAGDRVRLGPCDYGEPYYFNFEEIGLNGLADQIQVAGNPTLCVTFQGANPDDNDLLLLKRCQDTSRFEWSFRSGWYELSSGEECVQVRNQNIQDRNRVVWDNCVGTGFSSHWRIDGQGLFHVRENDNFCMRAVRREAGAPVRIAPCNSRDPNQLWRWPDGFEAPIYLARNPNLGLVVQGRNANPGSPMVLGTDTWEWSGDGV